MPSGCIQLQLFGGFRARVTSHPPVTIPPQQAGAVLAYLALHPNRVHSREELVETFWPDDGIDEARQKLRRALHGIRQLLRVPDAGGEHALVATRATVQLNSDLIQTDVAAFESLVRAAGKARDPHERVRLLNDAVGLYQGELLPGFYHDDLIAERNRLADVFRRALHSLADAQEQIGDIDEALAAAQRLVSLDPLVEESRVHVMRLHSTRGHPAAVQRQYQELARILESELGVKPSAETDQIVDSLLQRARSQASSRANGRSHDTEQAGDSHPSLRHETESVSRDTRPPRAASPSALRPRHAWRSASLAAAAILLAVAWIVAQPHRAPHSAQAARAPRPERLAWAVPYSTEADEADSEPSAVTSDADGNIYVTGFVQTKAHDVDILTMKYRKDGTRVWRQRWNNGRANDCDRGRFLSVDSAGNVYVTGETYNGDREIGGRQWDMVTLKYDSSGRLLWSRLFNRAPNDDDRPLGMAPDDAGNLYLACSSSRPGGGPQCVLMKYDANGENVWTVLPHPEPDGIDVKSMTIQTFTADAHGNTFLSGGASVSDAAGHHTHDVFTLRYDRHGNQVWRRRFATDNSETAAGRVIAVDDDRNVYVAGPYQIAGGLTKHFTGSTGGKLNADLPRTGYGAYVNGYRGGVGVLVVKYDSEGNEVWSAPIRPEEPQNTAEPRYIAIGKSGDVYVTSNLAGSDWEYQSMAAHLSPTGKLLDYFGRHYFEDGSLATVDDAAYWWGAVGNQSPSGPKSEILLERLYPSDSVTPGAPSSVHFALPPDKYAKAFLLRSGVGGAILGAAQVWNGHCHGILLLKYAP